MLATLSGWREFSACFVALAFSSKRVAEFVAN
jgi:hypothetical protein